MPSMSVEPMIERFWLDAYRRALTTRSWRIHSCLVHPWRRSCWDYRPIILLAIWRVPQGTGILRWRLGRVWPPRLGV